MSFTADTSAVGAAAERLTAAGDRLGDPASLLAAASTEVVRLAAPRTPRRTGRLAGSPTVAVDQGKATVRWGVPYGVYVNFGTRRMRAQPFATDALAAAQPAIDALAAAWATDALQGV